MDGSWLAPAAVDGLAQLRFVGVGGERQRVQRLVEFFGLFAHERDVEAVPVLDQHLAVTIEQHAARRRQRQSAEMVFFGHLAELLVLGDLENPESDRQRRKRHRDDVLQHRQPRRQAAAIVGQEVGRHVAA